jgi:hypothetical protein
MWQKDLVEKLYWTAMLLGTIYPEAEQTYAKYVCPAHI